MIPTVQEMFAQRITELSFCNELLSLEDSIEVAVEFAKLHVEAALKAAAEKVELKETTLQELNNGYNSPSIKNESEDWWAIDSESILGAYPLTNIK